MDLGIGGIGEATEVGSGGTATVYRARQERLGRDVAVKVLNIRLTEGTSDVRRRFEREQLAMGRLADRPGVVPIYDSGLTPDGRPYLIMPFYPNGSLQDRLGEQGPLPPEEAATLVASVAMAIDLAHRDGIFHRDIKPGNIMITRDGQAMIGDFGVARLVDSTTLFRSQTLATTPAFSAPEVFADADPSAASDIYSLAATLFALVSGAPAFVSVTGEGNVLALMRRIETEPVPDLRVRGVPDPLAEAIERGMAKDPDDRPTSAAEFASSITVAETPGPAPAGEPGPASIGNGVAVETSGIEPGPEPPAIHPLPGPVPTSPSEGTVRLSRSRDRSDGEQGPGGRGSIRWHSARRALTVAGGLAGVVLIVIAGALLLSDDDGDESGFPGCAAGECADGYGGSLPDTLTTQQIVQAVDLVFQQLPDTSESDEVADGFPNIPRRTEGGVDVGPDWEAVAVDLAEPISRDLTRFLDGDAADREAFDDLEEREYTNPYSGVTEAVIIPAQVEGMLALIAGTEQKQRLPAGSESRLVGPCMGQVWSYDADGQPLDMAFDWDRDRPPLRLPLDPPGPLIQAATAERPFAIDLDGALLYTGMIGGFQDGRGPYDTDWSVETKLFGSSPTVIASGGRPNEYYQSRGSGAVVTGRQVPSMIKLSGLVAARGRLVAPGTGNGAFGDQRSDPLACTGFGFVRLTGGVPASGIGMGLVVASLGALFVIDRRRVTRTIFRVLPGLVSGTALGLGLALIAVGQGRAALGTWPPIFVLGAGTTAGVLWSYLRPFAPEATVGGGGEIVR